MNTPGYESLASVLTRAYNQAAVGKGKERHAQNLPFTEQPMQSISDLLGSNTGLLYQAMKKIQESQRLDKDAAVRELLGAINYIAGAVIWMEKRQAELDLPEPCPTVGSSGDWTCRHGGHDILPMIVPVGQACPICFSV